MENAVFASLKNRIKPAQVALDGYPWLLATVLYTLSWGWSLLRPNTLYWDDWAYVYNRPKSYLNQIFVDTGLPPWRALIDQELIAIGYWTIPVLTFLFFFTSSIALFLILKTVRFFEQAQVNLIILMFLLAPVNHARIALVMFGYTTSYFLFFVAWAILVMHKKPLGFWLAATLFIWSFMTHSFLFFYLLPFTHFIVINFASFKSLPQRVALLVKLFVLGGMPIIYYILRSLYWPPIDAYESYHKLTLSGLRRGLIFLLVGVIISFLIFQFSISRNKIKESRSIAMISWGIFAWGLMPYFINQSLKDIVSVFAFRADWGTRHLLLTPLGIALIMASFVVIVPVSAQKLLTFASIAVFVCINIVFASQYLLDSYKKEQLSELFKETEIINSDADFIFIDEKKIFNGRFSTYRNTELLGLIEIANKSVKSISGKSTCEDIVDGYELKLKSAKNYSSALLSRDLGLYFEISEC